MVELHEGEVAIRRVHNGYVIRGRACDVLPRDPGDHVVEVVFEDASSEEGGVAVAVEHVVDHLFEGYVDEYLIRVFSDRHELLPGDGADPLGSSE